jgi:hypothetical protein
VQVQDARLAAHQSGDVALARHAQELVERRLARAVVADGELAEANHAVDVDDVAADRAGQCLRRQVVAAGVAPRAQTLVHQGARLRHELGRRAHAVVGAERPHHRRHAGAREARERDGRDAARVAGLAATARDVRVAVDEPRDHPSSAQIGDGDAELLRHLGLVGADPQDAPASDQQVAPPERCGRVDVGVEQELQHRAGS